MSIDIASKGGRICFFALPYDQEATLPCWEFYDKELLLTGSNKDPGTIERALAPIETKKLAIETLITHRIALDEIPDIFRMLTDGEKKTKAGVIKVVIHP